MVSSWIRTARARSVTLAWQRATMNRPRGWQEGGWVHVGAGLLAGCVPWVLAAGQAIPGDVAWAPWLLYAAPPLGLLVGALFGLGYFILSGVLRVLLDQRDLLEDPVQTQRRLLQVAAAQPAGASALWPRN
jgi:hypothetical protein